MYLNNTEFMSYSFNHDAIFNRRIYNVIKHYDMDTLPLLKFIHV
jgi:hypothetical protein